VLDKYGYLRCDFCRRKIEKLSEDDALGDLIGHGWSDWRTAKKHSCYHCSERLPDHNFPYETYFAGRYRWVLSEDGWTKEQRVYELCPDLKNPNSEKMAECYFVRKSRRITPSQYIKRLEATSIELGV